MTPCSNLCQIACSLPHTRRKTLRVSTARRRLLAADVVYTSSTLESSRTLATKKLLRETDLYPPVADYLGSLGYTVRSEVANCDITAAKGDDLIIVELKRNFSTDLLIQAAKRQRMTDSVYVALPRPANGRKLRGMKHLLRRLELGLIFVSPNGRKKSRVEVAFHPVPFQVGEPIGRRALLGRLFAAVH